MRRSSTPCRRALSAFALLAVAALATGCVTRSRYNRDVGALEDQRDQLTARVADLERSNEALGGERLKLIDEMEDLRVAREDLAEDVAQLEKTRDLLSTHLREREAQVEELSKLSSNYEALAKDLEQEVAAGQIQITQLREGLRLNLAQDILFRSGAATLEPYGVELLTKVSEQLAKFPQQVEVQGHTDNVPVSSSSRWGTNWELAAARAASVVRLFEKHGVDPKHLTAVSYGQNAPVDSNDTPEGRARNRRIDIRLKPIEGSEEAAAQSPGAEATPAQTP
jgi:chemotaxis protein MotB